ncbi:MAG: LPS-assembly protein LptD, partial [Magnetococcales bacterium]|nr:LPS-assembly protein LptD [Magnetococcales bacterium]
MKPDQRLNPGGISVLCLSLCLVFCGAHVGGAAEETPFDLDADQLHIDNQQHRINASGKVKISQPGQMALYADEASYIIDKRQIQASGNIRLERQGDLFFGHKVDLNVASWTGILEKPVADLKGPGGHVSAAEMEFLAQDRFQLREVSYTNCDCKPGEIPAWQLKAGSVDVNSTANTLTARNATLQLGEVPVLWTPWWRHPLLPERQSGFLFPSLRMAGGNGFEADVPYYWNIAPDRDATLTAHPTSRRGLLTKVQYRYMGDGYVGQLDTQNIYDSVEERHRGLTLFQHQQTAGAWDLDARLAASQTRDFLHDFPQKKLIDSRERRLESHLEADHLWLRKSGYSDFQVGALWYENLQTTNDRYTVQRLPYMSLTDSRPLHALDRAVEGNHPAAGQFRLNGDYKFDSFYQISGDAAQRVDLSPELQYWRALPVGNVSGAFGLRETSYLIQGNPNQTGDMDGSESRASASGRLRLSLDLARTFGNGAYKHTLEPAVQYAVVSATRQSGLPNFDSTLRHFGVNNLYSSNLYSGDDRISTGQWMAYGLTSRLFGRQGDGGVRNLANIAIGQRWAPPGDRDYQDGHSFSDLVSGLDLHPTTHWTLALANRYDPYNNVMKSTETSVAYSDANTRVSVGYHLNKPETQLIYMTEGNAERLEDLTFMANVKAGENWRFKQNADYSLETSGLKSWRSGIVYEESCWSLDL